MNKTNKYRDRTSVKVKPQCRNKNCERDTFILDYENKGYLQEIKKQIIEMTLSGSGIRDISRVLGVSINTVLSELKKRERNPKCKLCVVEAIEMR